jgi:hypothetical protein
MQRYFDIPGTIFFADVRILPIDCPIALIPLLVGGWMYENGLLSGREKKKFRRCIHLQLLMLEQQITKENSDIDLTLPPDLIPEAIRSLANFSRPLRGDSVLACPPHT